MGTLVGSMFSFATSMYETQSEKETTARSELQTVYLAVIVAMDGYEAAMDEATRGIPTKDRLPSKEIVDKICAKADDLSKAASTVELVGSSAAAREARNVHVVASTSCGNATFARDISKEKAHDAEGWDEVGPEYEQARQRFLDYAHKNLARY